MKRCSLREWIPILPMPVWPLAWQCLLGQNTVAGSMIFSFWLCVEAYQEEYVGIPIFITTALHHGSGQRYQTPSYRWKNEGILPDLSGCRISRTLQVHDRTYGS